MNTLLYPPPIVWPLTCLLFALIVLRVIGDELKPITRAMVPALASNASKNATVYAIAFAFGLSASLSAFYDMFKDLDPKSASALGWWQITACIAKVLNPFVVASLAYVLKPFNAADSTRSQPPFQSPQGRIITEP